MATKKKKTNDGKSFENAVHTLLTLKGVSNLSREKQFESKKADMYFEMSVFGGLQRYGVECKDLKRTLTKSLISSIYSEYQGFLQEKDITNLLVISNNQIAPGAQSYVDSITSLSHMTLDELRNSLIDFRDYLMGLKSRFNKDPALSYYFEPQGTEGWSGFYYNRAWSKNRAAFIILGERKRRRFFYDFSKLGK